MGASRVQGATRLVGAWTAEAARLRRSDLVFFADSAVEREVAEVCNMACSDQYFSWEIKLAGPSA